MSVATQISRLTALRDRIRTKLVSLGLASSSDKLAALTDEIESITAQSATTITPSESSQTAVAAGKYTTGAVTVGAISNTYVGSGITRRDSTSLTASGATISVPAGYYASAASKAISSGSATTPATTVTANPSISVNSTTGLITATASATKSVTPSVSAGYVSSGTAGTITVSGSNTSQLSVQAAATITPTESSQTAVEAGKYTTGAVTVGAISSTYVGSGITRRSSSSLTVSGATVTAPAGYYASAATKTISSGSFWNMSFVIDPGEGQIMVSQYHSAGYYSAGTQYGYYAITTQPGSTVTPGATSQTVVNAGTYVYGNIVVAAAPQYDDGDIAEYGYEINTSNLVGTGSAGSMTI